MHLRKVNNNNDWFTNNKKYFLPISRPLFLTPDGPAIDPLIFANGDCKSVSHKLFLRSSKLSLIGMHDPFVFLPVEEFGR